MAKRKTNDLKVSDKELKSIQEKVNSINKLQMTVGGLEIQKSVAMEQIKAFQDELNVLQNVLEKKYGKVSVNITDGTIAEIPQDNGSSNKKN